MYAYFHFSGEHLFLAFSWECSSLPPKASKVGEGGQTQIDQGTTPTTRRPRLLSFIQGPTLRFFFASGDSEETRVLMSLGKKTKDEAVLDRVARAG